MGELQGVINGTIAYSEDSLVDAIHYLEAVCQIREEEFVSRRGATGSKVKRVHFLPGVVSVVLSSLLLPTTDNTLVNVGVGVVTALAPAAINTIKGRRLQREIEEIEQVKENLVARYDGFDDIDPNSIIEARRGSVLVKHRISPPKLQFTS